MKNCMCAHLLFDPSMHPAYGQLFFLVTASCLLFIGIWQGQVSVQKEIPELFSAFRYI